VERQRKAQETARLSTDVDGVIETARSTTDDRRPADAWSSDAHLGYQVWRKPHVGCSFTLFSGCFELRREQRQMMNCQRATRVTSDFGRHEWALAGLCGTTAYRDRAAVPWRSYGGHSKPLRGFGGATPWKEMLVIGEKV